MVWLICSRARSFMTRVVALRRFSVNEESFQCSPLPGITYSFLGHFRNYWPGSSSLATLNNTLVGSSTSYRENPVFRCEASSVSCHGQAQEATSFKVEDTSGITDDGLDLFDRMKQRFLRFKKNRFLEEAEHFQALSRMQSPKFMVIACVDSRVCPSNILGFQPGEAFMVRNVANLVPPLQNGPSETNAALEFAVNTLQVENILVIGHSSCAGIQALMNMQEAENHPSFVEKWVSNAKVAKLRAQSAATHLGFDQQCQHCEKESINCSLLNLLTYPWIEEKMQKRLLSVHGGYYDFLNCTFEKWTLDINQGRIRHFSFKDRTFWC